MSQQTGRSCVACELRLVYFLRASINCICTGFECARKNRFADVCVLALKWVLSHNIILPAMYRNGTFHRRHGDLALMANWTRRLLGIFQFKKKSHYHYSLDESGLLELPLHPIYNVSVYWKRQAEIILDDFCVVVYWVWFMSTMWTICW